MASFRRILKAAAALMVLATVVVIVIEMEIFCDPSRGSGSSPRMQRREDIMINPFAQLPNEGRIKKRDGVRVPELSNEVGTRSPHNGAHQKERQLWLEARAKCVRNGGSSSSASGDSKDSGDAGGRAPSAATGARPVGGGGNGEAETRGRATAVVQAATADVAVDRSSREGAEGVGGAGGGGGGEPAGVAAGARDPAASHSNGGPTPSLRRGAGLSRGVGAPSSPLDEGRGRSRQGIERMEREVVQEGELPLGSRRDNARLLSDAGGAPRGQGGAGGDAGRRRTTAAAQEGGGGGGGCGSGEVSAPELPLEERLDRLEVGVELWGATYVPPIAPEEKQRLVEKWTSAGDAADTAEGGGGGDAPSTTPAAGVGAPRILFVLTSFDRGRRLGPQARAVDKLDYLLMIMDEIRETCEAGFSPHAHLIAAWDPWPEYQLFLDRLFCRRIGAPVPLSLERHSPSIKEVLSIKHRIYMKPRVQNYDLFIQMEDDMILTVNHILRYLEESEKLSYRKPGSPMYDFMPGFVRVEPEPGATGVGGEWFEWEIVLSRFRGLSVKGAGTYLGLEKSRVLPFSGNNQGFWMATQGQLKYLQRQCQYLRYTEKSSLPFVEKFSGSLEMFSPMCHNTKVFPADSFENFMVHHRTNNKNGKRGESNPAVSVSMMRLWASQVLRDEEMLMEVGDTGR